MKKAAAAGALLALLFLAAGWNIRYVDALTGEMLARVEQSRSFCREQNLSAARAALGDAMSYWQDRETYTHIFIRHAELDGVSDAFYDVLAELESGEADAAEAAYGRLEAHLRCIDDTEQVTLGSVF